MSLRPGRLRQIVSIERSDPTRDEWNGEIPGWVAVHPAVWAEIVPLSGREFIAAQAAQAAVSTRITIRYHAGITQAMRVRHGSILYNIKAVLPDPTLRDHLTLMCETGVRDD